MFKNTNELRIAFINNKKLFNLEIENKIVKHKKGNIYKGVITKIEKSLDAVFIDYGVGKDGFLPFKEMSSKYLNKFNLSDGLKILNEKKNIIGKTIIVQVEKEEKEEKGVSLTTFLSLAGCYVVILPNNSEIKGISKRINSKKRYDLKEKLKDIFIPKGMSVIIRTLGFARSKKELIWELNILLSQFKIINNLSEDKKSPCLIYKECSLITKIIRDYLKSDTEEIIIDSVNVFNLIYKYLNIIRSEFLYKITLYNNSTPLFCKYNIENQIELIFKREVFLPSGGSIIIDYTEALTSIDINSSKSNKCDNIKETSLQTNFEAINEIARQLRIRDLGGIIIIDFIDIVSSNKKLVEKIINEALSNDKAKIKIGEISQFGLLEISRQQIKPLLLGYEKTVCYLCNGIGKINNIESLCSNILRSLEEESFKPGTYQVHLELSIPFSNYIMNAKKYVLTRIEQSANVKILLIVNKFVIGFDYKIYRFKVSNKYKWIKC